jgi:hypothetical protein
MFVLRFQPEQAMGERTLEEILAELRAMLPDTADRLIVSANTHKDVIAALECGTISIGATCEFVQVGQTFVYLPHLDPENEN